MDNQTVGIIGAGHVGSHVAMSLVIQGICRRVVLIDTDEKKARAQADDLMDGLCHLPWPVEIKAGSYEDLKDAQVVVMAACGAAIEEDRLQELADTLKVTEEVASRLKECGFQGVVVSISNPCDVIAQKMWEMTGLRVLGTGTALDSARFSRRVAALLGVAPQNVCAYMLGEHGDSQVAALSQITVSGQPLAQWMERHPGKITEEDVKKAARETVETGWQIVLGKGSTEFGVASAAAAITRAILRDEKRVMPCSALLTGQYGQEGIFASTLCVIGRDGAEEVWQLPLNQEEEEALVRSCEIIRRFVKEN